MPSISSLARLSSPPLIATVEAGASIRASFAASIQSGSPTGVSVGPPIIDYSWITASVGRLGCLGYPRVTLSPTSVTLLSSVVRPIPLSNPPPVIITSKALTLVMFRTPPACASTTHALPVVSPRFTLMDWSVTARVRSPGVLSSIALSLGDSSSSSELKMGCN